MECLRRLVDHPSDQAGPAESQAASSEVTQPVPEDLADLEHLEDRAVLEDLEDLADQVAFGLVQEEVPAEAAGARRRTPPHPHPRESIGGSAGP